MGTHSPTELPVVVMRGGTSKGVFVRADVLPPPGANRDALLLRLMGTPDPMQIDGLGGTHSSTSKVMVVDTPSHPGDDIDYEFAQVGIDRAVIDWSGNCGNLTAAVAAYAVDEGYLDVTAPVTTVTMRNVNTGRRIVATVPVEGGRAATDGMATIAGVPGTGAAIHTRYPDPGGAVTGTLLPTGGPVLQLAPSTGATVAVSIVDVTAPVVIVRGADIGHPAVCAPSTIAGDAALLERLESIRGAAAVAIGMANSEADALTSSPALPRVALVWPRQDHALATGEACDASEHDIVVRAMSLQRAHHACPLTTAMCLGAAMSVPGTIAAAQDPDGAARPDGAVRIAHPKGIVEVTVRAVADRGDGAPTVEWVSVMRTARPLLRGTAFVGS